ncbi:MAG: divalent-cation tolerance protein CutA [Hyphomicrobiales bacterium]|nr:divalent-cation tolerance protein CutA [Hyphomicrobiales bacterium]
MSLSPNGYCMVLTTAQGECTQRIIEAVLSRELAACVQVMPIRSHYVWQGVLRDEAEELLFIKAKVDDWEDLKAAIVKAHTYDIPEVLRFDVEAGGQAYLEWITAVTRKG